MTPTTTGGPYSVKESDHGDFVLHELDGPGLDGAHAWDDEHKETAYSVCRSLNSAHALGCRDGEKATLASLGTGCGMVHDWSKAEVYGLGDGSVDITIGESLLVNIKSPRGSTEAFRIARQLLAAPAMEKALEPFSKFADELERGEAKQAAEEIYTIRDGKKSEARIHLSDFRNARAALALAQPTAAEGGRKV